MHLFQTVRRGDFSENISGVMLEMQVTTLWLFVKQLQWKQLLRWQRDIDNNVLTKNFLLRSF